MTREPLRSDGGSWRSRFRPATGGKFGGAEGTRTPDPHNAIVVLYQLSYDPTPNPAAKLANLSGRVKLGTCPALARAGAPVLATRRRVRWERVRGYFAARRSITQAAERRFRLSLGGSEFQVDAACGVA